MEFSKIVAVVGLPGLYQVIKSHKNGLLVRMLGEQRIELMSNQKQFSLLEAISIYTKDIDSVALSEVLQSMQQRELDGTPPPAAKVTDKDLSNYFSLVLPDYDRIRVSMNDIKKIVKWYNILKANNAIPKPNSANAENNTENLQAEQQEAE